METIIVHLILTEMGGRAIRVCIELGCALKIKGGAENKREGAEFCSSMSDMERSSLYRPARKADLIHLIISPHRFPCIP